MAPPICVASEAVASDLIRSMRGGGAGGVAAAREFFKLAESGQVPPGEVREAQKLVATLPELRDAFTSGELGANSAPGGESVFRDVSALTPDTERLTDGRSMGERFLSDLKLVEHPLLNHPGLTRAQKAERLFEFFEKYAERFQELAQGTTQAQQPATSGSAQPTLAPPLTEPEFHKALAQFDKALDRAGFGQLMTGDGRTGTAAAKQMLEARTAEDLAKARPETVDAPGWKDNPPAVAPRPHDAAHVPVLAQARTTSAKTDDEPQKDEQQRRRDRSTNKVLGSNMLWNAMHLFRGDDLSEVEKRDAMNAVVVVAGLVLGLAGLLVGLLVYL